MRRAAAIAAALFTLGATASAAGHGGLPELSQLAFAPGDPMVLAARTNFGLIRSDDGGASWGWICGPAYHGGPADQPVVVLSTAGEMVVGVLRGLVRGTDGGCTWTYPDPDLERAYAIDIVRDPRDVRTLWTVTSSGGVDNRVWRSADEGLSWDPVSEPMPDILFETMRLAPSDPMRAYLTGTIPEDPMMGRPRRVLVSISIDGAMTFEHVDFALEGMETSLYLLGVDPTDADHLYARTVSPETERLVVSDDGGRMWSTMLTVPQIRAFAQTDDGATVWVGGDMETGLYRSEDHGVSFLPVPSAGVNVLCLALRGGELWACTDPWLDGFALARSADRGDSFEPLLQLSEIEPLDCPTPDERCERLWPMTRDSLIGRADAGVPLDGAIDPPPPRPSGGGICDCGAAGAASREPLTPELGGAALVLGTLAITRRLRPRRRPSPRTSPRSLFRSAG